MEGIHAELAWQLDSAGHKIVPLIANKVFLEAIKETPSLPGGCSHASPFPAKDRQSAMTVSQALCHLLYFCLAPSPPWLCDIEVA